MPSCSTAAWKRFCLGAAALSIAWNGIPAMAQLPAPVDGHSFTRQAVTLDNGLKGEPVAFTSRSPVDFAPLLRKELGDEVELTAQFFRPKAMKRGAAAVVMIPGSGGIGPHHLEQAAALTDAGLAVLLIDPFHGRGIGDTIADQGRLTWAASSFDVIAAVRYLQSRADIDPSRIGAVGSSRGGSAVLFAMSAQISFPFLGDTGIRAAVAGYPWCGTQFHTPRMAPNAALLLLSGDRDDWVSLQQCQDFVHAMTAAGNKAAIHIFPGALHAFDRSGVAPTRIENAVTSTSFPTVYMDDAGHYYDPQSGQPDPALKPADFARHAVEGGFMRRGVTVGTTGDQADRYTKTMVAFLVRNLARPRGAESEKSIQ